VANWKYFFLNKLLNFRLFGFDVMGYLNQSKKDIKEKKLFIFFGVLNVFFTNIILQISLIYFSTQLATFLSQLFNLNFGFYMYGKKVFKVKELKKRDFINYFMLNIILWNINWGLISFLNIFNISRNISALALIPFLALLSYVYQKQFIFLD